MADTYWDDVAKKSKEKLARGRIQPHWKPGWSDESPAAKALMKEHLKDCADCRRAAGLTANDFNL